MNLLAVIKKVLNNESGPAKDIVKFNSGAAIYVAGLADSLEAGILKAEEVIASGAAKTKLDELIKLSNNC